jgi:ABC-type polysaccharide/polyol phosphate transport system ATPase subunit
MALEETISVPTSLPQPHLDAPPAIQVEGLSKTFRLPTHRVDSIKERVVKPFSSPDYRELKALDDVSFEVHKGEFFGIVGRNGSGKSTLLKLLASIYRADTGKIRMAGRLAPFIELGVGFNVELTARENVVLNGVMMGLTPREARTRLDAVLEFAELEDFIDLKLKNYSSGMLVRLAFSLMMEVDADIMLIDEVLAVGDAAFQQKCADAFHEMKAAGKTIILVTHSMSAVEAYCHRAMLIDDSQIQLIGDPSEVGRRYLKLNFEHGSELASHVDSTTQGNALEILDARVENAAGEKVRSVEQGATIKLRVELAAKAPSTGLEVGFIIANADGLPVAQLRSQIGGHLPKSVAAGERVRIEASIDNLLVPGRYFVHCGLNHTYEGGIALYVENAVDFVVFGGDAMVGMVDLPHEIDTAVEGVDK